jgi:hypothetical protein
MLLPTMVLVIDVSAPVREDLRLALDAEGRLVIEDGGVSAGRVV